MSIKFGARMRISILRMVIWPKKIEFYKLKMADGRHIENRFLAISRCHSGRLMRNLDRRWRFTCRYRSRDQNGNFRKFKISFTKHSPMYEGEVLHILLFIWKTVRTGPTVTMEHTTEVIGRWSIRVGSIDLEWRQGRDANGHLCQMIFVITHQNRSTYTEEEEDFA